MEFIKQNLIALIACIFGLVDLVLWVIHKFNHTEPAKRQAEKLAKQQAKDKVVIERLTAKLEKIEKKYRKEGN